VGTAHTHQLAYRILQIIKLQQYGKDSFKDFDLINIFLSKFFRKGCGLICFFSVLSPYGVFQLKFPSSRSRARCDMSWMLFSVGEGFPLPPIIA